MSSAVQNIARNHPYRLGFFGGSSSHWTVSDKLRIMALFMISSLLALSGH